jgi:hypothetical protein
MAGAPQCFISVNEQINQPPGAILPAIPPANDMQSALAAIAAMRQMLMQMTGQIGGLADRGQQQGSQGNQQNNNQNKKQQALGRWTEINRAVGKVTLKSTDGSVTFEIDQINKLTFQDTVTKEQFVWNR